MKPPSPLLRRAAKWLAAIAIALFVAASVGMGSPGDPEWWLGSAIIVPWQAGPILLATAFAHASRDRDGQLYFLLLAVAFMLFAAVVFIDVMQSTSSTAVLAWLFYPLFEYVACGVMAVIALLFGWRGRDDWLKG